MAYTPRPSRPPAAPFVPSPRPSAPSRPALDGDEPWSPTSWRGRPLAQEIAYDDAAALDRAVGQLRALPPLVTSWEVERLRQHVAEAQRGERFVLQGGDCAEMLADCRPEIIANKLKILLQMSLVLVQGSLKPVVRIGRLAGQYAKPRSKAFETRADEGGRPVTLPSYFGDLVNRAEFTAEARRADPQLLLAGYQHAALTLNFVRSLSEGGFADLHHPEHWDMSFYERADLSEEARAHYERASRRLVEALRFMEALGETSIAELTRVEFFTSHEGLNLHYESAQTRTVPRRPGWYDLTTHLPWIGERTRQLDGAHVEFFRGVANPVGVKVGPSTSPDDVLRLIDRLNPLGEEGKLVLVARMGAGRVAEALPGLVEAVRREGKPVLWMSDPMHGNTVTTSTGVKTRNFDEILREIEVSFDVHEAAGGRLGGVHFELTGEDVTECIGGGLGEGDLDRNYATECDPRLNYRQALEMAFRIAHRMAKAPASARSPRPGRSGR
jgi:3-deoxy-7-phosphoheptulonate synthase